MKKLILFAIFILASASLKSEYWKEITNMTPEYYDNYWLDIYFLPNNLQYGWVCGFRGQVLRTTNGGDSWIGSTIQGASHLESIHFVSQTVGYTSGVEGIFKSTDGGASWSDVTPDQLNAYWGCYFLNENLGLVLGGGCGGQTQKFYKTTDGGDTWSLFELSETNSGLTDLIIYPNGEAYASGSGTIFRSTDFGSTWYLFTATGDRYWQEEITKFGNSFLVPTSGVDCQGGGSIGSIRFSTNLGGDWEEEITPNSMFGTFLIDGTKGWACGYDRLVYYTSNAGVTWELRNCGIRNGNLDDIWFNSPSDGWVVGQGVYRIGTENISSSRTFLQFDTVCIPNSKFDSLFIKNLNFYSSTITYAISGTDAADFSVTDPASGVSLSQCEERRFLVKFAPSSPGLKRAVLKVTGNNRTVSIDLYGFAALATITAQSDTLIIDNAKCGVPFDVNFLMNSTTNDIIKSIKSIGPDSTILKLKTDLPFQLIPNFSPIGFTVLTKDTGWTENSIVVTSSPCNKLTNLFLKIYSKSPIIETIAELPELVCKTDTIIKVVIRNTGNDDLKIADFKINPPLAEYSIIGMSSKRPLPFIINKLKSDTLLIKFKGNKGDFYKTNLVIMNNDSTKARGKKNPWIIPLDMMIDKTDIQPRALILDYGTICLGNALQKEFLLRNLGNQVADFTQPIKHLDEFTFSRTTSSINGRDSFLLKITFKPNKIGTYRDTILIPTHPCNDTVKVIVVGKCISSDFTIEPNKIDVAAQTNTTYNIPIKLKSIGSEDVNIISYEIKPKVNSADIVLNPSLPQKLIAGADLDFVLSFTAKSDSVYKFDICFTSDGLCPKTVCRQINISTKSRWVTANPDSLIFEKVICQLKAKELEIEIKNYGNAPDTISSIKLDNISGKFSILNMPNLPYKLESNSSYKLKIQFEADEIGLYYDKVTIKTIDPAGQVFVIPIKAEFYSTATLPVFYSLNFGEFEKCEPKRTQTLKFVNSGNIADTLLLSYSKDNRYKLIPPDQIIIPSNDSVELIIEIDPSKFTIPKHEIVDITLNSKPCNNKHSIKLDFAFIKPSLSIDPSTIDFGSNLSGTILRDTCIIENNSDYVINIDSLILSPNYTEYKINLDVPKQINKNAIIKVPIEFKSLNYGSFDSELKVYYSRACKDSLKVQLKSTVPSELYRPELILSKHKSKPGDTINISMSLKGSYPRVDVENLDLDISYDSYLIDVYSVSAKSDNGWKSINNAEINPSNVKLKLDDSYKTFFHDSGTKVIYKALVLAHIPDYTDIKFDKADYKGNKNVDINKVDGSLQLYGYCGPIVAIGIKMLPYFEVNSIVASNNSIDIDLKSFSENDIDIRLVDVNGRILCVNSKKYIEGKHIISLDISQISSGVYYLSLANNYNSRILSPITIVK